jgi:hypothetical protein
MYIIINLTIKILERMMTESRVLCSRRPSRGDLLSSHILIKFIGWNLIRAHYIPDQMYAKNSTRLNRHALTSNVSYNKQLLHDDLIITNITGFSSTPQATLGYAQLTGGIARTFQSTSLSKGASRQASRAFKFLTLKLINSNLR